MTGVPDVNYIRMAQAGCCPGFLLEKLTGLIVAGGKMREKDFECDAAVNPEVVGAVDRAESANAYKRVQPILV
jgi:hypothetical protein